MMLMIMLVVIMLRLGLFGTWDIATCTDVLAIWVVAALWLCRLTTTRVFARAVGLRWQRTRLVWQSAVHVRRIEGIRRATSNRLLVHV
jgi:hypothetical protein